MPRPLAAVQALSIAARSLRYETDFGRSFIINSIPRGLPRAH
jgi:hypothetical protein